MVFSSSHENKNLKDSESLTATSLLVGMVSAFGWKGGANVAAWAVAGVLGYYTIYKPVIIQAAVVPSVVQRIQ